MWKILYVPLVVFSVLLTACGNGSEQETADADSAQTVNIILTFSSYDMQPATRAAVGDFATRLDVWLYENGEESTAVHQQSTQVGFGTLALTLDKRKTYTIYALAHKSTAEATVNDGVAHWADGKVTQTFYYTSTFSPADGTTLSCVMNRIVGNFRLNILDEIPAATASLRFDVPDAAVKYNIFTGQATGIADRTVSIQWDGAGSVFSIFLLASDTEQAYDITVTALDAGGNALQQREFIDVPIRNGYQTTYRGNFFIDTPMSISFTVNEWNTYDPIDF